MEVYRRKYPARVYQSSGGPITALASEVFLESAASSGKALYQEFLSSRIARGVRAKMS